MSTELDTSKKVVLLGWDGADWQVIQKLLDEEKMPNLQVLVERGCMGNLATMKPVLSPILWTTIATGKTAEAHGIYGFVEPRPDGGGVRPVTSTSIQTPTLWEIVEQAGLKSAVVSWFASHPADRFPGIVISDMVANATGQTFDEWPLPPRGVSPKSLEPVIESLRVHPTDISPQQVLPFVPKAAKIDRTKDQRLNAIARFLARCSTVHAAATHIAEHEEWNLLAVYYETIDRMCHYFMECTPPKMRHVPEEDVEMYQGVVEGMYRFHDMMLGRYMKLLGPETTIVICSDHGFYSGAQRPNVSSNMKTGNPVAWHRQYGVFLASGPGIRRDELLYGASVADIAPTILSLFGLPVGRDMDGRVLTQIFDHEVKPRFIDKYQRPEAPIAVDTDEGDPWAAQEAIAQLVALGYIAPPSEDAEKAVRSTTVQRYSNLAQTFMWKRQYRRAVNVLRKWQKLTPRSPNIRLQLARCLLALDKLDEAGVELEELLGKNAKGVFANALYGEFCLKRGDEDAALEHFERSAAQGHRSAHLHNRIGMVLLKKNRIEDAVRSFERALEIDADNASALDGLGSAAFARKDYEQAISFHMRSIGLTYQNSHAHFHLGMALAASGRIAQAAEALVNALKLQPNLKPATRLLEAIQRKSGRNIADQAFAAYRDLQSSALEFDTPGEDSDDLVPQFPKDLGEEDEDVSLPTLSDEVVIVTGLPRSGTSMMMQMLVAGGLPALSDNVRNADEDNPKGYFEHEDVKQLHDDAAFLDSAKGQSVKVIHALLRHLPENLRYRVIFMRRRLEEILDSQHQMLSRSGQPGSKDPKTLAKTYGKQLLDAQNLLDKKDNCQVLYVDYNETLTDAEKTAKRVNAFLGSGLDVQAMSGVVDTALYRQRHAS